MQGFLAEGLQRTAAGLGSVIIDSQPLSVAVLAAIFFGERLTAASVAGLLVGAAGLCLLELPPEALLSLPQTLQGESQSRLLSGSCVPAAPGACRCLDSCSGMCGWQPAGAKPAAA